MNTLENRLLEIAAKGEKHEHSWVVDAFRDSCGSYHLEDDDLEEENGRLYAIVPEDIVYCWRCGMTFGESDD